MLREARRVAKRSSYQLLPSSKTASLNTLLYLLYFLESTCRYCYPLQAPLNVHVPKVLTWQLTNRSLCFSWRGIEQLLKED